MPIMYSMDKNHKLKFFNWVGKIMAVKFLNTQLIHGKITILLLSSLS